MITTMNNRRTARSDPRFGAWLLQQIESAGLTRNQFADRVGVSHVTVGRWIKGRIPDPAYIDPIADVLVLGHDAVATRAGYRPRGLDETDPDAPGEQIAAMARRVQWDPERFETMRSILTGWLERDRQADKEG